MPDPLSDRYQQLLEGSYELRRSHRAQRVFSYGPLRRRVPSLVAEAGGVGRTSRQRPPHADGGPGSVVACGLSPRPEASPWWSASELRVRPIHHRTEERVPTHTLLCLLAYYVEWHLRRAWAPLLFEDEQRREVRERRDPVGPAKPSESARQEKISHQTQDGLAVHSFETLMAELATRARVTYGLPSGDSTSIFKQVPEPTPLQARAYELLGLLPVAGS